MKIRVNPTVTVILTSRNHDKFVGQAIQSVLDQTFQDFELIIVDDYSSDASWEIINKFKDERIRAFRNSQQMRGAVGINDSIAYRANGKYIAIHHSDDIFLPDKLEKQVRFLNSQPEVGAVFGYAEIIDEDGNPFADTEHFYYSIFSQQNCSRHEWLRHFFYHGNCLCHPSVMVRKDCYSRVGLYDRRFGQIPDLDMWVRICLQYPVHIIQEPLIKFRVLNNEVNSSGVKPEMQIRIVFEMGKMLNNYLDIQTFDELVKIFPEASKFGEDVERALIPYVVAMLALDHPKFHTAYGHFGINVLFSMLQDNITAQKLKDRFEFDYVDFVKLTGSLDVFNVVTVNRLNQDIQQLGSQLYEEKRLRTMLAVQLKELHNSAIYKIMTPVRRFFNQIVRKP